MARYTMELREMISTFGEDEVKSWFMDYDLSDYLTHICNNLYNLWEYLEETITTRNRKSANISITHMCAS